MKRQSARVCGKSCGAVPRNDRAFVPLAFILSLFLWTGCIHRKVEAPPRPSNVPQEAQWYGGADGGCWIIIHDTDTVNRFHVRCFFDGSGNLREEGIYEVDTTVTKRTYTAEELREAQKAKIIDSKVMALGGSNEDNLLEIKDFGFGGAVVLGDLWNKFDACLDQNYLAVIKHFKKLKKLAD